MDKAHDQVVTVLRHYSDRFNSLSAITGHAHTNDTRLHKCTPIDLFAYQRDSEQFTQLHTYDPMAADDGEVDVASCAPC